MNDGVEIRMETVITGVYGDGSVIDNNAAGCMEAVLFRLDRKNSTGNIDISKLCVIRILRFDRTVCSINIKASIQNFNLRRRCGLLWHDGRHSCIYRESRSCRTSQGQHLLWL